MSNFQRTRSKVWWGDGSPNVGSPVAQAPDWNQSDYVRNAQDDWAPQLPHWIANEPIIPPVDKSDSVVSPNLDQAPVWPQRQGSPGSHKSQDSGFSDSDSSPPVSQYYSSPDTSEIRSSRKSSTNEKSTEPDTNNNDDITSKSMNSSKDEQSMVLNNTVIMRNKEPVDSTKEVNSNVTKQRFRSSSVIQTPYDLQKYIEVHSDEAHLELLIDKDEEKAEKRSSNESTTKTPHSNVNKNHTHSDKCTPPKKNFVESQNDKTRSIKVAQIKDLSPTSKKNKQDQIEYIHLSSNDQIAVNNQPRIRSPITRVSYQLETREDKPPETPLKLSNAVNSGSNSSRKYRRNQSQGKDETETAYEIVKTPTRRNNDLTPKVRSYRHYRRSQSQETDETDANIKTEFQRNRLNKSLNYEAQRLDQQILDIQDYQSHGNSKFYTEFDNSSSSLATRNITDSLQLKIHKKPGPKAKQKFQSRTDKNKSSKCTFRIFPTLRRESPRAVGDYAGGVLEGSRVPALGLPRSQDDDQWVMVGYPENEKLVQQYNERLIGENVKNEENNKPVQTKEPQSCNIPPPLQYQDAEQANTEMRNRYAAHNLKQDKLKSSTDHINFLDGEFNVACTSTPKMLAPKEYMANATATPQNPTRKHPRPPRMNLLDDFNESATPNNLNESLTSVQVEPSKLEQICDGQPEPVQYWLCDVVGAYESECMTTLQSKALGSEMKALVSANSATITGNIKKVQTHGQIIVHQYSDVLRSLDSSGHCTKECEEQICFLVANINEFILAHSITLNTKPPGETPERWDKVKLSLQVYLQRLIDIGEDVKVELNESMPEIDVLYRHLDSLVDIFIETTKAVLIQQLKTLVSLIEEPPSDMILKSTLTSVSHLAMLVSIETESNLHAKCVKIMKSISDLPFVDCCVPRALLTAIIESNKSSIKALSLRALATICVMGDAVKQFEEAGGIEIISDILSDKANPEPQIREAITVLTQITAPWLKEHYDLIQLHSYLDGIIKYITDIITRTSCCQLLLLCTACIVNLARTVETQNEEDNTENKCDMIEILAKYNTIVKLLEAVKRRGPNISVFLQEQTASLLSLISQSPAGLSLLSQASVVTVALICFVRPRQTGPPRRPTEARAHYRMLHHSVSALSRLCMVPDVATQIIQLEGIPRLIRLVRTQRDQSDDIEGCSDQILMACLKILRCLYKYHTDAFLQYPLDVQQMIQPHLMESLVLFSAKQESYV